MADKNMREQFLIAMYNQLMNDINRHIIVVWQSVTTLIATFAAFSLVSEKTVPLYAAVSIILATCIWLILHVYDASYWYNRNLVIIANIERQFLKKTDLKDIHYYFGKHRPIGSMISHLKIQRSLGVVVSGLVLTYHLYAKVYPQICSTEAIDLIQYLPLAVAIGGAILWYRASKKCNKNYQEFLNNSPGIEIDTADINYGSGHGFNK